jgi:hypothetical protein
MSLSSVLAPSVDGHGRRSDTLHDATTRMYVAGSALGGLVLGLLLAAVTAVAAATGSASSVAFRMVVLLIGLLAVFCAFVPADRFIRLRRLWPYRRQQVPGSWIGIYGRGGAALRWGVFLGSGFMTYVDTTVFFAAVTLALLAGDAWLALGVGLCYGLAKGAAFVVTQVLGHSDAAYSPRVARRLGGVATQGARWLGLAMLLTLSAFVLAAV